MMTDIDSATLFALQGRKSHPSPLAELLGVGHREQADVVL